MINRIHIREVLAWTAVLLAVILFTATIALAQETVKVTNEDGKVHIETKSTQNGITVTKDTTFQADKNADIEKIVDQFTGNKHEVSSEKEIRLADKDHKGVKQKTVIIDMDKSEMKGADREKLHEDIQKSMEELKNNLKEMHMSFENMNIKINDDNDNNDFNFELGDGHNIEDIDIITDNDLDSLRDKDHIIIVGDEQEKAPVLENIITKNGKQVFIFKRVNPVQKEISGKQPEWIENFSCFPNPSSGRITVKFKAQKEDDFTLTIVDEKGKTIVTEKMNGFSGNYSKEIDLTTKGKGNYMVTISDKENSLTKKIVVN